jgi:hypothetical protein
VFFVAVNPRKLCNCIHDALMFIAVTQYSERGITTLKIILLQFGYIMLETSMSIF